MALLKKIKASTLMETLVATVLIIVIFMMASLILNTMFSSTLQRNTSAISERLQRLEYEYKNGIIEIPYYETWDAWEIEILGEHSSTIEFMVMQASNKKTDKIIKNYAKIEE